MVGNRRGSKADSQTPDRCVGSRRITEIALCDAEWHDLIVPACMAFDRAPMGYVPFGTECGWLDDRLGEVAAGGVPRESPRRAVVAHMFDA
jgi:hypothetical protein